MTGIFDHLRQRVIDKAAHLSDDLFILRGLWRFDIRFKPDAQERLFSYTVILAGTTGQGSCYCAHGCNPIIDSSLIGKDARHIVTKDRYVNIAILDAIYSSFQTKPDKQYVFYGDPIRKSNRRANILANEVLNLVKHSSKSRKPSVLNIGVVGNVITRIKNCGIDVCATDLDESVIGRNIAGIEIQHGRMNDELLEHCDVALVTGMALSTGTIDGILEAGKRYQTKIILFAETGANFSEEYCRIGFDVVISEPFPFYIFQGTTKINIYYRDKKQLR